MTDALQEKQQRVVQNLQGACTLRSGEGGCQRCCQADVATQGLCRLGRGHGLGFWRLKFMFKVQAQGPPTQEHAAPRVPHLAALLCRSVSRCLGSVEGKGAAEPLQQGHGLGMG